MLKRYRQQISKLKKELKSVESKVRMLPFKRGSRFKSTAGLPPKSGQKLEELESQKQKAEEDKEIMMQMLRDAEIEKEKQREKLARMMNMIITSSSESLERPEVCHSTLSASFDLCANSLGECVIFLLF